MTLEPYKMKVSKPRRENPSFSRIPVADESDDSPPLTGFWGTVQLGSEHEERLLRGLSKLSRRVTAQYEVMTPYSLPGQGKQIDIIVWDSMQPIEVDGPFHARESSQALDEQRDAILNEILQGNGFQPIKRINYMLLANQELADKVAEGL